MKTSSFPHWRECSDKITRVYEFTRSVTGIQRTEAEVHPKSCVTGMIPGLFS